MDDHDIVAFICCLTSVSLIQILQLIQIAFITSCMFGSREEIIKIPRFYERIAPMMPPRIFRRYFRMYEETLGSLTNYLSNNPILYQPPRYVRIPLAKKVAMTTAYLGSSTATIQLAHLFGIAESTFLRITEQVMDAMIAQIDEFIRWPTEAELPMHAREFDRTGRFFPNVIGALDDLHVEIKLTEEKENHRCYFCWKQYYSIHLQAVATYDMRFLDIFVGWPGRSHDARVFKNNPLYRTLSSRLRSIPLPRLVETYHILADSAFPVSPHVMTSIKKPRHRDLNHVERKFNRNLNSKRSVVERSFSLLLQRFPRLLKLNQKTIRKKIKVVMAACILHNVCILENDNIDYFLQQIVNRPQRQIDPRYRPLGTVQSSRLGALKRLQLANIVFVN